MSDINIRMSMSEARQKDSPDWLTYPCGGKLVAGKVFKLLVMATLLLMSLRNFSPRA